MVTQHPRANEVAAKAGEAVDLLLHGIAAKPGRGVPASPSTETASGSSVLGFDRKEQNRLKQEAFFKTGTWYFNKKGFTGTSLDEIAEHLDVSKGAFYYHIKNKEDLLYHCDERSLEILEQIHARAEAAHDTGLERAAYTCRRTFFAQNSEEGPLIRYNSITALPMDRRQEILKRTDASNALFGDLLKQGIADGSVRTIDTYVRPTTYRGCHERRDGTSTSGTKSTISTLAASEYFRALFDGLAAAPPHVKDS